MRERRIEREKRFAQIYAESRYESGKSQEYMATKMGVTKKTIQNWEKGISSPSLFQSTEWFHVLGINPMPYYLKFLHPEHFSKDGASHNDLLTAVDLISKQLSARELEILLYLFYGQHGSSPSMILELILAHLHCPMKDRILHGTMITKNYELAMELNMLACPDEVLADAEALDVAIDEATSSVMDKKPGYTYSKLWKDTNKI